MKRDSRANLWFLVLFLGISLPGAVILFKKKLDPTSSPMGMPDFIRRRLPYMVPLPTPDSQVTRVIPPLTGDWVSQLARERCGGAAVLMRGPLPVTSADRIMQVVAMADAKEGGTTTMCLLAWEGGYGEQADRYRVTASSAGESSEGRVASATAIPMPQAVKRELMSGGYVKPSANVTWVEVKFDAPMKDKRPLGVRVEYAGGSESPSTEVKVDGN
jgi:hypothetical protein